MKPCSIHCPTTHPQSLQHPSSSCSFRKTLLLIPDKLTSQDCKVSTSSTLCAGKPIHIQLPISPTSPSRTG